MRTPLFLTAIVLSLSSMTGPALAQGGAAQPQVPPAAQGQMPMGQMPMMGQGGQMPMMGQGGQMPMGQMPMMGRRLDRDDESGDARPMRQRRMMLRQGPRVGWPIPAARDLSLDEIRRELQEHLDAVGNARLKLGAIAEQGDRVLADIVTVDNSLVQRVEIDRRSGAMRDVR